jgi:translation initiation factor IF-2
MRVHELAKKVGVTSKELIVQLTEKGVEVKNHMSALTDDQVQLVLDKATQPQAEPAAEPEVPAPEPPAAEPEVPAAEEPIEEAEAIPDEAEPEEEPEEEKPKVVTLKGTIVVKELAEQLEVRPNQLIAELMGMNVFASINAKLDLKIVKQVADKHGYKLEHEKKEREHKPPQPKHVPTPPKQTKDKPEELALRPPVVAFLGHVDHGKTSLLDYIRKAKVAAGEDGGITQHIGAYSVPVQDNSVTFLDTPGHAAFTAMRARGANLTDIVVIIIAADDGIMPQTREAIQHAKAADVTIMVAINKIDLPGANVDRVMQQLQQEGLAPEEWGGETICCPVSAQTGEGTDHLLEMIALQAEVLELKANPNRSAQGYVVEAQLEPGRGPTATVLVRRGTLKVGDAVTCGTAWGRIKALINDQGVKVRTAGPSSAVKCLGLTEVPDAGAEFTIAANDRDARAISDKLKNDKRMESLSAPQQRASLEDLFNAASEAESIELPLIIKTDVQGSMEAIVDSLNGIESDKVSVKYLLTGVGNVTANDVLLAAASNAIILGFHVSKENGASATAKREGIEIRLYSIIYELIDDVREAMTGLLSPESREKVIGHAEIREIFDISKSGRVAGCMITDGQATSKAKARVKRGNEVIYEGSLASLKRFQNDAATVREGQECGIRLDNFAKFEVKDVIELYDIEEVAQTL